MEKRDEEKPHPKVWLAGLFRRAVCYPVERSLHHCHQLVHRHLVPYAPYRKSWLFRQLCFRYSIVRTEGFRCEFRDDFAFCQVLDRVFGFMRCVYIFICTGGREAVCVYINKQTSCRKCFRLQCTRLLQRCYLPICRGNWSIFIVINCTL